MDIQKLKEMIEILQSSELAEIEFEEDGLRLRLKKPETGTAVPPTSIHVGAAPVVQAAPIAVDAAIPTTESAATPAPEEGLDTIDSPMVGTFYSAPAPGDPLFVHVGDTVEEGQTVCIVEAMKLMNEVTAKAAGVIEKILVENAEPVEFGQPLFAVRPSE